VKRVLVTGSRHWKDRQRLEAEFDSMIKLAFNGEGPFMLIEGACPSGADFLAKQYAKKKGWEIESHPAEWKKHKKQAGHVRNQKMVDLKPDVIIAFMQQCKNEQCKNPAFHYSHGTTDCVERALSARIPLYQVFE